PHTAAALSSRCLPQCGPAPALRSFPTRRSSDLHGGGDRADEAEARRDGAAGELRRGERERDFAGLVRARSGDGEPAPRGGAGAGDRKSTRLNSSHVKISYAVFCLKKKKVAYTVR